MPTLIYNDCLSAYQEYPAPIRPYLLRAESHPTIRSQLTKSIMRVFIDLLARTPIADPGRPIEVFATGVAAKLGVSTKTVARAINLMADNDWLVQSQDHDGRNNMGEFSGREFIIGNQLRELVGLPTAKAAPAIDVDKGEKSVDNYPKMTKLSDGVYGVNKVFKNEAPATEAFQKEHEEPKAPPTTSTPKIHLPKGLEALHNELGISKPGICSLMQLARDCRQRLQDVWIAKGHQILDAGAREGRAKRYFEFLLRTGEDFSYAARSRLASPGQSPSPAAPSAAAPAPDHRVYWNRKYAGAKGLRVSIHGDGSGEITDANRQADYIAPRDMVKVYEAIATGKLWAEAQ